MKNKILFSVVVLVLCFSVSACADMLEDAKFMGRLTSYVQDHKNLKPALGLEQFEGKITGIKDTSPYIRQESAQIVAEYGGKSEVPVLKNLAAKEQDYFGQDKIYLAAYQLELKCALSEGEKEAVVAKFFSDCLVKDNFKQGIPRDTFEYLLEEAEDGGMTTVNQPLIGLQNSIFKEDETMSKRLGEAGKNITFRAAYKGIALYQAILKGVPLQDWMLRGLIKENAYINQAYANAILDKLLIPDSEGKLEGTRIYQLKEMMEKSHFLRAENKNAGFELRDAEIIPLYGLQPTVAPVVVPVGFKPYKIDPVLPGWDMFISQGSKNSITFADAGKDRGASGRCLEIKNEAVAANTAPAQTLLVNEELNFAGKPVKSLEFGLSYKMYYPKDSLVFIGEEGVILSKDGQETVQGKSSISLCAVITLQKAGETATSKPEPPTVKDDAPYNFNYFEQLNGRYEAPQGMEIKAVQLSATISGSAHIYLDNIFVRRGEQDFMHNAPEVISTSAAPQTACLGEKITLKALVSVDGPADTKVSGQWASNLEGLLGSKVEGVTHLDPANPKKSKVTLTIQQIFTKDGEHTLFFTPVDNYGMDAIAVVKLTVVKPVCNLAPQVNLLNAATGRYRAISGPMNFNLTIGNLGGLLEQFNTGYSAEVTFMVDGIPMNENFTSGTKSAAVVTYQPQLATARLANGLHEVKARVKIKKTGSEFTREFYSNSLMFNANNTAGTNFSPTNLAPRIIEPAYGAIVSRAAALKVGFDNPGVSAQINNPSAGSGARLRYVDYQLLDQQNNLLYTLRANRPFSATLDLIRFKEGIYNLLAIAYYSDGTIGYSEKVKIQKK